MTGRLRSLALPFIIIASSTAAFGAENEVTHALSTSEGACSPSESWNFGPGVERERADDFRQFLKGKMKPVQGFAEGLAQRRIAQTADGKAFGEYWVSRALYEAKLYHIAFDGFAAIAGRPADPDAAGVQIAAIECLLQIETRYPSMTIPENVLSQLKAYQAQARTSSMKETIWAAGGARLRYLLSSEHPQASGVEATLALLSGSGAREALGRGLWAASRYDHSAAIRQLTKFTETPNLPQSLKRYMDMARILLAHSLYSVGKYDRAGDQLRLVSKASNELASTLSELSWAFLMNERYPEAIGTAMNLQAGGLRHTFSPEGEMVAAMALNELCQYPDAVRAIQLLRKNYEKPYRWLATWAAQGTQNGGKRAELYMRAMDFLQHKGDAPERVASEWVRSPLVIASQDEINAVMDEQANATGIGPTGAAEQRRIAEDIIRLAEDVRPKLQIARMKMKAGDSLPKDVQEGLESVRRTVAHFRRLQHAAPVWRSVLATYQHKVPIVERALMARINADLDSRSARMLEQLDEISENVQLIEIEIYNGASHDIIWQNAHPDYREIAKQMKDDSVGARDKVWDWGRSRAAVSGEDTEIWEDELGSFKANLFNNCSSKDRYLALKLKRNH